MISSLEKSVVSQLKPKQDSGGETQEVIVKLLGPVPVCRWDRVTDSMSYRVKLDELIEFKRIRTNSDIVFDDMKRFGNMDRNRRSLLSVCNGIFDPINSVSNLCDSINLLNDNSVSMKSSAVSLSQGDYNS